MESVDESNVDSYIYIDFETTGLGPPNKIYPTQLSAQCHTDGKEPATYNSYVIVDKPHFITKYAINTNGIDDEMIMERGGKEWNAVAEEFIAWVVKHTSGASRIIFVAHNGAGFDFPLFCHMFKDRFNELLQNALYVCSLELCRRLYSKEDIPHHPQHGHYSLRNLWNVLCPNRGDLDWHNSIADCVALVGIWNTISKVATFDTEFDQLSMSGTKLMAKSVAHFTRMGPPRECACGWFFWRRISKSVKNPGRVYETCHNHDNHIGSSQSIVTRSTMISLTSQRIHLWEFCVDTQLICELFQ